MDSRQGIKRILSIGLIVFSGVLIFIAQMYLDSFQARVLNLAAIFVILGVSMNLVLGFTGMFSLGHAGFMCVGAYVSAVLTMSPASKELIYYMEPIISPLGQVHWPVLPAILAAGLVAALFGFIIGFPL